MTWGSLFRHEVLSKDAALKAVVPEFLRISMDNVVKVRRWRHVYAALPRSPPNNLCLYLQVGYPSKNDSPCCEYSRLDCDSDEDFNTFFNCE